jgi:hypothetical protein
VNGIKKLFILLLCACLVDLQAFASARSAQGKYMSIGSSFVVAIQADGSVKAVGDNTYGQCDTSGWRDVVSVATGIEHTLGLKSDGTVYTTGSNELGQCNVEDWKDIVMIAANYLYSYGLTRDGKVLCTYNAPSIAQTEMEKWKDIVWLDSTTWSGPYAIDKDGIPHVVGVDVSQIRDAVQVYDNPDAYVYILKSDGTVQYMPLDEEDQTPQEMDRGKWLDIIELDYHFYDLIGLKRDGTVVGFLSFKGWEDIVEFEGGFGVKSDGSIMMDPYLVDLFTPEQLAEISTWKVMVDPDTLPVHAG